MKLQSLRRSAPIQAPRAAPIVRPAQLVAPGLVRRRSTTLPVVCAAGGLAHPGEDTNKGDFLGQFDANISIPNIVAAKGGGGGRDFGSGGSLGAVMEKSKMNFVMPTPPAQAPKLDDGGSGGDIGKHNHNGGGGGDGDGGDDDDYFNEDGDGDGDGEGEGGNSFFRTVIPESYDKFSIGAVFAEWMRTVAELPLILRRAVEMGLFSSAQLVRFFSMDVRPNLTRNISRSLPPAWARDFVGRLMADPAFVQKMAMESVIAACASLWYEYKARGDRFKDELDLVLINTLGMAAATSATVWMVAPTRSYGNVHKFPWQQMLENLPNCVFDANGPLRQYTTQSRVAAFFSKAAELSAVGLLTGTATSLLSSAAVALRQKYTDPSFEPSVPIPDAARSGAGLAAFFALSANTRYQLLGGMDRYLIGHSNFLWTYLAMTTAARVVSNQVGETHRPFCQGLPEAAAPKRRVVKRKVVVRKKVVKPQVVPPEVQQQPEVLVPLAAGAAAAAVASEVAGLQQQGQGQQEVVLDQVLALTAEPAEQGSSSSYAAAHGHEQGGHQAVTSTSAASQDATVSNDESAIDLASLVAQQSSGVIELPALQPEFAGAHASSGSLVGAGQR